ncbi:MAG: hypothetical protein V2J12_13110 [Gammaproteobacteria bacterium]|jgi:hypothetical protein|nr:hypothetical protein [Gammaproteobacteria bacterium]
MGLSIKAWLVLCLLSVAAVPAGVFLGGMLLAGPYAGANGLFSLMGDIYGDALALRPSALLLLSSPVLFAAIWAIALAAAKKLSGARAGGPGH